MGVNSTEARASFSRGLGGGQADSDPAHARIGIDNIGIGAFASDYRLMTGSGVRHSKGSMTPQDRHEGRLRDSGQ